jgi:8-oxo-dGTP pyrophosphatase MutT (NUDIX family)
MENNGLPVRRTGKVLLMNQSEQLLMFRATETLLDGSEREIWFPPGGGAEGDETFAECASRELLEETGLRLSPDELGPAVAFRRGAFVLDGVPTWSDEVFFFVAIPEWTVDVAGFTELEREQLTGHRWWPLCELRETERTIFPDPREMIALVTHILASGHPAESVELSWLNPPGMPRIYSTPQRDT